VDGSRFDALTRSLSQPGRRRRVLAGLAAGALGLAGRGRADAVVCRPPGQLCRENANCCSRTCGTDAAGRRTCQQCRSRTDCPAPGACRTVDCVDGACTESPVTGGACTPAGGGTGVCEGGTCVAQACPVPSSCGNTQICGSFPCICAATTEGDRACVNSLSLYAPCASSGDCRAGQRCLVGSCFGNICQSVCGPAAADAAAGSQGNPWA
jgi:hypothetical protein